MEGSQFIDDNSKQGFLRQVSFASWLKRPKNCRFSLNDSAKSTSVLSLKACTKSLKRQNKYTGTFPTTLIVSMLDTTQIDPFTKETPLNEVQFTT